MWHPINRSLTYAAVLLASLSAHAQEGIQQQDRHLSPQYLQALERDIAKVQRSDSVVSVGSGFLDIAEANATRFPIVEGFFTIRDGEGAHILGLTDANFTALVSHPSVTVPLKVEDFSVTEVGTSSSKADLVFVLDTTGSMSRQINVVINNVLAFVDGLSAEGVDYRLAGYSYGDEVPYRSMINFTGDAAAFKNWVTNLDAVGGNDWPENPLDSIVHSGTALSWRSDAQQIIMLVTDAPAHVAGDGGDSNTSATFSSAAAATAGKAFFYSSPESDYASLGTSLGWPFNDSVLLAQLSGELVGRYAYSFTDPVGESDSVVRELSLTLVGDTTYADTASYEPEEAVGELRVTVYNTDLEPRVIPSAIVDVLNVTTGDTASYVADDAGVALISFEGDAEYTVTAGLVPRYAKNELGFTTTSTEDGVTASVEELTFNLPLITVEGMKSEVLANLERIKAYDPVSLSSAPFADEAQTGIDWVTGVPTEADGDSGPSDAQLEGLTRMYVSTGALNKANHYVKADVEKIGSSVSKIVVTVLDLTETFKNLQDRLLKAASALNPDSAEWAITKWTYEKVKSLFELTASKLGKLSISLSNTMLDVVKMNLPPEYQFVIDRIKDLIAISSANPNLPVISDAAKKIAIEALTPIYANGVDATFQSSINRHSSVVASLEPAVLQAQLASAEAQMAELIRQAELVKTMLDDSGKISDVVGVIGGLVSTIDNTLDFLPKTTRALPAITAVKTVVDTLDKALKGADIAFAASDATAATLHFNVVDDQIEDVIHSTSNGINSSAFYAMKASMPVKAQFSPSTVGLSSTTAVELFSSSESLSAFQVAIVSGKTLLADDDYDGFFTHFIDVLLPASENLLTAFNAEMELSYRGNDLSTYYKPGNYDALMSAAATAHTAYTVNDMAASLSVMSQLLGMSLATDAQTSDAVNRIIATLNEWNLLATQTAQTLNNAVQSVASNMSSYGFPFIASINIVSNTVSVDGKVTLDVVVRNIGGNNISHNNIAPEVHSDHFIINSTMEPSGDLVSGDEISFRFMMDKRNDLTEEPEQLRVDVSTRMSWGPNFNSKHMVLIEKVEVDSDEDAIPDNWELAHGLDPNSAADAHADLDDDHLTNYMEFKAGLDPSNSDTVGNGKGDFITYTDMLVLGDVLAGDVNKDSVIDAVDVELMMEGYGVPQPTSPLMLRGDFNRNGRIDLFDIQVVRKLAAM